MGILDLLEKFTGARKRTRPTLPRRCCRSMSEVMGTGSQGGLTAIVAKLQQAGT